MMKAPCMDFQRAPNMILGDERVTAPAVNHSRRFRLILILDSLSGGSMLSVPREEEGGIVGVSSVVDDDSGSGPRFQSDPEPGSGDFELPAVQLHAPALVFPIGAGLNQQFPSLDLIDVDECHRHPGVGHLVDQGRHVLGDSRPAACGVEIPQAAVQQGAAPGTPYMPPRWELIRSIIAVQTSM